MDAWSAAGRDATAAAAAREAIRTAEQTVGDAWIGRLLLTESEAEATVAVRTRLRERALGRVREAQRAGDLSTLVRAQLDLEFADRAWSRAVEEYELARRKLNDELALWSEATANRVGQAWADRSAAGRR
jgi:hypothetical protein